MFASAHRLTAALVIAVALSAAGCGDSASENKSNPALGEPSKDGPPKRGAPGAGDVGKKKS